MTMNINKTDYAFEQIVISTNALPFTAATVKGLYPYVFARALVSVESAAIRYRFDGTAPTSSVGHPLNVGDSFTLEGLDDILNFKAIRDVAATGDATITVTYVNAKK